MDILPLELENIILGYKKDMDKILIKQYKKEIQNMPLYVDNQCTWKHIRWLMNEIEKLKKLK